jgi:hypothetical protein
MYAHPGADMDLEFATSWTPKLYIVFVSEAVEITEIVMERREAIPLLYTLPLPIVNDVQSEAGQSLLQYQS